MGEQEKDIDTVILPVEGENGGGDPGMVRQYSGTIANVIKAVDRTVPGFTYEEGGKYYHDFQFMQFTDTQFGLSGWLKEI